MRIRILNSLLLVLLQDAIDGFSPVRISSVSKANVHSRIQVLYDGKKSTLVESGDVANGTSDINGDDMNKSKEIVDNFLKDSKSKEIKNTDENAQILKEDEDEVEDHEEVEDEAPNEQQIMDSNMMKKAIQQAQSG